MNDTPKIIPITSKLIKDIADQRFGRLLALGYVGKNRLNEAKWLCQCDCGNSAVVTAHCLRSGGTQSCGCIRRETTGKKNHSHGLSHSIECRIWYGILDRCRRPTNKRYQDYGGRGITVCERWQHSFENFLSDMGARPGPQYSVDRIDNNKGYSPDNCRWATPKVQRSNSRRIHVIEFQGERLTLSQWAERIGMTRSTLSARIHKGWTIEEAFTRRIGRW